MGGLGAALLAMTLAQALATMAIFVLPVLAPSAAASFGVGPELIGAQVALVYTAAAAVSAQSGRVLARCGSAGATQIALLAGAAGIGGIALGGLAGAALGSLLAGLGYGLTNPAATQVLNRLAPPQRRNMVFSLKQMGVPLGAALAGFLLPSLALLLGWRGAALCVAGALLLAAVALQPFRAAWDAAPGAQPRDAPGRLRLRGVPGLPAMAASGAAYAAIQLALGAYAVTMLVEEFGWSPVAAGAAAATSQVSGAVARLGWAWLADRAGSGKPVLATIGLGTALCALAMPFALSWPAAAVVVVLAAFGSCSTGWTGVSMAEVARLAPPGAAGAAAGATLAVTFSGVVVGPLVYAGVVALLGSYTEAFAVMAALPLAGAAIAWRAHRAERA